MALYESVGLKVGSSAFAKNFVQLVICRTLMKYHPADRVDISF